MFTDVKMKRKAMSLFAILLILFFFSPGIYLIYTLVHNWDEFSKPVALYTIDTDYHKYYVRNHAVYDEQNEIVEELTQIYRSLLYESYKKDIKQYETKETPIDNDKQRQMFNNVFEDNSVFNPQPKIHVITTSKRISVSRWREAGDWRDDDDYEIEIPEQTIIITQ